MKWPLIEFTLIVITPTTHVSLVYAAGNMEVNLITNKTIALCG
jgi:hypothetical protein